MEMSQRIAEILDAATPMQRVQYASELRKLSEELSVAGAMRQIEIAKRVRQIIFELGNDQDAPPRITLKLGAKGDSGAAVKAVEAIRERYAANPFDDREVIIGGAAVEVYRWEGRLHLSGIRSMQPGEGAASAALNELGALADEFNVEIELQAEPFGSKAMTREQLEAWYARHGYVRPVGDDMMIRKPGAKAAEPEPVKPAGLSAEAFADLPQGRGYKSSKLAEAIEKIDQARAAGSISNVNLKFIRDQANRALEAAFDAIFDTYRQTESAQKLRNAQPGTAEAAAYNEFVWEVIKRPEMHTLAGAVKRLQKVKPYDADQGKVIAEALALSMRFMPIAEAVEELKGLVSKRVIKSEEQKAAERSAAAIPATKVSQLVHDVVVAQRPDLEEQYKEYAKNALENYVKAFGPSVDIPARDYKTRERFHKSIGRLLAPRGRGEAAQISDEKLQAAAEQYAQSTVEAVVTKIMQKAGELEEPEVRDFSGANFTILGKLKGKPVALKQQIILNRTVNGELFNQYPLRITLDGKAVSEAEYKTFMLS